MRDAKDVRVERAIVHIVNHRDNKEPTLSEAELPLRGHGPLRKYFSQQVQNALVDVWTGAVSFSSDGTQTAIQECFRILNDGRRLVPSSQELARLLFAAMKTHGRVVPGSLAVCLYKASNYPGTRFLALIKIDPGRGLVQTIDEQDGKRIVSFERVRNVMPSAREKLHKAALIPPKGSQKKFDLLLLDRQTKAIAAEFFADTFLNTITTTHPRATTEDVYSVMQNVHNDLVSPPTPDKTPLTPEEAYEVQQQIHATLLSGNHVDLERFPEKLPEAAQAPMSQALKEAFPESKRLPIDRNRAREILKKTRFRGDFGVMFEVESEHYKTVVKEENRFTRDGQEITSLLLEVPRLRWVKQ
jgi:37-kD nucleoid-associated bacterial protein